MKLNTIPAHIWNQWVPAFGIIAVIGYYGLFLYRHVINVPYQDDILDILQFLSAVLQSTDIKQTFGYFFESYNEHRTLASRVLYYLAYVIEGEVNFRTLIFLVNLSLVAQLLVLYLAIRKRSHSLWLLLPAALILFQPRAYALFSSAMGAYAYMFVYLYGFASLLCLREVKLLRFLAAIVFATLAMFSLASGQLVWLVGLASLLQQSLILRRCSLAYPLCWFLSGVMLLIAWHIGHESPHTMTMVIDGVLDSPVHHIAFLFTLMGAAVTNTSVLLAFSLGCAVFGVVMYWSIRSISSEDITLELFASYVILTMVAITAGRADVVATYYALESRLSVPSELLVVILTLMWLCRSRNLRRQLQFSAIAVLFACAYWSASFRIFPAYMQGEFKARVAAYNSGSYWVIFHPVEATNSIVQSAITLGIYHPPARPLPEPDIATYIRRESLDAKYRSGVAGKLK